MDSLLERPWQTCSDTEIRQRKVKRKSGCEGGDIELGGREEGRGVMEEYSTLTRDSIGQYEYTMEHSISLPTSGPPIDPHNTREYIPEWFSPVATLSQCTHDGRHYYDEANDFNLEIPEGAIPEGETITIDIGVALYGPFHYPEGLRPVSPVFWLCVRDKKFKFFHFLKPVRVTIPHFLNLNNYDDIESLGLAFLKGDHEWNLHQLHKFQNAEGDLFFEPLKNYGVLQTMHFCSLCISGKISRRLAGMEVFCISAVIPHTFTSIQPSYAYFYITYLLATCLTTVKEQIKDLQEHVKIIQELQFSEDQPLEIVLPPSPSDWEVGLQCNRKVCFLTTI